MTRLPARVAAIGIALLAFGAASRALQHVILFTPLRQWSDGWPMFAAWLVAAALVAWLLVRWAARAHRGEPVGWTRATTLLCVAALGSLDVYVIF